MSRSNSRVPTVRVPAPLAPYVAEFTDELTLHGYTPSTQVGHLRVMAHLSKWLRGRQLGVADLTVERVEEYLAGRRSRGYSSFRTARSLTPLLGVLAAHGAPVNSPQAGAGDPHRDGCVAGRLRAFPARGTGPGGLDGRRVCVAGRPVSGRPPRSVGGDTGRGQRGGVADGADGVGDLGADAGACAALAAAVCAPDRAGRDGPVRGCAAGDRPPPLVAAAGHRPGRCGCAAGRM